MDEETTTITASMSNADRESSIIKTVQAYSKRLMGFIRKQVPNEADAEDVLQDVFYQLANYTQPIEQITAWLFTVARNKITDRHRKKQPELFEMTFEEEGDDDDFVGDWKDLLFDATDNPEVEYLRGMFWETLYASLDELPSAQREVFVLNELEDVPFKVISEQTGETVNTLLSRKRYAVLHLRKRLQSLRDELLSY